MFLRRWFGKTQSLIPRTSTTINRTNNSNVLTLENLPNELLFVIFDYLYCHEIIFAFDQLNNCFQSLLDSYLLYHLIISDEKNQSKLNLIRQLLLNTEHVKSLILSENLNSVINVEKFLSIYPMERFSPTLQCLSLNDLDEKLMISIVLLLSNFQQLKALSIADKYTTKISLPDIDLTREIILFKIPTLRYFTWNIKQSILNINSTVSNTQKSTIEYFYFHSLPFNALQWVHSNTLNLKSIFISNPNFYRSVNPIQTFENLIFLKLKNINSISDIQFVFECLTNSTQLKHLELRGQFWDEEDCINGYKWEDFIEKYCPQLEVFNFFFIIFHRTTTTKLNEMIESFKTNFWLIKHKWFVTCDYQPRAEKTYFYSIPCLQTKLDYSCSWIQISTSTIYNDTRNIRQLTLDSMDAKYLHSCHRFTHIQSLILRHIGDNITYDQLNRVINLSSITHLEFQSETSWKLFFTLLRLCSTLVSIGIDYKVLVKIIQKQRGLLCYSEKMKSLKLTYSSHILWEMINIDNFSSYFSNIEELIVEEQLNLSEIAYLIGSFKHLYFLAVRCSEYKTVQNENIHNKLFSKQNRKFKKTNITYQWMKDILYIWVK